MVASKTATGLTGGLLALMLAWPDDATAFPFADPTNLGAIQTGAPLGAELPAQDVTGLGNQLRLVNPAAPGNPSAWTIIPRLTLQEMFTDNAYEVTAPRRADAITLIAPGISIAADTARLKLSLDYQPTLLMHAINGPLNVLTQQLNAIGLITVVPDFAYVDVRAVSGVQSALGGLQGAGAIGGAGAAGGVGTAGVNGIGTAAGTGVGLNRNNEVQTSSIGISPYLLRQFGDYGSGKLGASVNAAEYSTIKGFAASPFPSGGSNGQSLLTTEEIAHYNTGQFLGRVQYSFDADISQTRSLSGSGTELVLTPTGTTTVAAAPGAFNSQRETFTNQLSYALNHTFTLLGSVGYQKIEYSGAAGYNVNGLTWSGGFTYAPLPDSSVTVTYGRQNGTTGFTADAHLAIATRSMVTFSYSDTVGTQLENLQNQLNNAAIGAAGGLVNAQTGAPALVATNALGVQAGVFRFKTINASATTQWDRDTFQLLLSWSEQTSVTPGLGTPLIAIDSNGTPIIIPTAITTTGPNTDVSTATFVWTHSISPDLTLSSSAAYSFVRRNAGQNDTSLAANVGLQYTLSASTFLTARYSFFDRISKIPGYSLYENLLLLGVTKQF